MTPEPQVRASGAGTATAIHHDGAGRRLGRVGLDPATFGVVPNVAVMHQVVTAQLAAARSGTQSTLTRAEVRGGGSKPYRQKGTGRARQGSTRAPQWVGGGVAFGPKPRSYRQRTPKKMVALALRSALSDRAGEGRVAVVDRWAFPAPRTRDAVAALAAIGVSGRVLVVVGPEDGVARKSFANLPAVHVLPASELNAYDVLRSDWVVFTEETLPGGSQWVAATGSPAATPSGAADSPDGEISAAPEAGAGVPDGSPTAASKELGAPGGLGPSDPGESVSEPAVGDEAGEADEPHEEEG